MTLAEDRDPFAEVARVERPRLLHCPGFQINPADGRRAMEPRPLIQRPVDRGQALREGLRIVGVGGDHTIPKNRRLAGLPSRCTSLAADFVPPPLCPGGVPGRIRLDGANGHRERAASVQGEETGDADAQRGAAGQRRLGLDQTR